MFSMRPVPTATEHIWSATASRYSAILGSLSSMHHLRIGSGYGRVNAQGWPLFSLRHARRPSLILEVTVTPQFVPKRKLCRTHQTHDTLTVSRSVGGILSLILRAENRQRHTRTVSFPRKTKERIDSCLYVLLGNQQNQGRQREVSAC